MSYVPVQEYMTRVLKALNGLDFLKVSQFSNALLETYQREGTIYFFGNGGSGANASHMTGDLLKGVSYGLEKRFKVVCLNDNISGMMAIANDISYDDIFVEPLKNFLQKDDLVVGISGSGNSVNIIKALLYAKEKKIKTVALCGFSGGKIKEIADISVHIPINDMEVSEDLHLITFHCAKMILMNELKNNNFGPKYEVRI